MNTGQLIGYVGWLAVALGVGTAAWTGYAHGIGRYLVWTVTQRPRGHGQVGQGPAEQKYCGLPEIRTGAAG